MQVIWSTLARARALDPRAVDAGLALAAAVGILIETFVAHGAGQGSKPVSLLAGAVIVAAVALRRRRAWLLTPLAVAVLALQHPLGGHLDDGTTSWVAVILLIYSLAAHEDGPRFVWPAAATAAGLVALLFMTSSGSVRNLAFAALFVVAPTLVGRALLGRRKLTAALGERTARLVRERRAAEARAVEEERARIAHELHDVVTHSLSVMTVQASAARRVVHHDGEVAGAALGAVEETGRAALTEMRRLLGVLRREDHDLALAPQPTVARADVLAHRFRERGLEVELEFEGEPIALTPGIDLAAYRVLEQALDSAIGHEARNARVLVRYGPRDLDLRVRDDGADEPRGGAQEQDGDVLGMRERVALYGGRLQAGRRPDGRYGVRALIPVQPVRA